MLWCDEVHKYLPKLSQLIDGYLMISKLQNFSTLTSVNFNTPFLGDQRQMLTIRFKKKAKLGKLNRYKPQQDKDISRQTPK